MTLVGKLDQLNAAEDRDKLRGPIEPDVEPTTGAWVYTNDIRDSITDAESWLEDGDPYEKAMRFQDYAELNDEGQLLRDLHAGQCGDFWTFYMGSTRIEFYRPDDDYDSKEWHRMEEAFGTAAVWDELLKWVPTKTLMKRLGYHFDEEA